MGYTSKEEIKEKYRVGNDLSKVNTIPARSIEEKVNSENLRVAVYCRVSTDGIEQTTSFELQKKYYIKYVRKHPGWRLCGLYSDEGISATTIKNRIGIQMMLKDAVDGKIDLIVIKSISRFCRNLGDSMHIIKELKNLPKPVGIFFETENMSTLDPAMDLIIKVLSMVAEEESKKKSEAITAACRQRYSEGFFNIPDILGYRRTGVNEIDVDEEEAKTVRLIYRMYLAGYKAQLIANTLTSLGRKKHTHIYLDGRVKPGKIDWNKGSVLQVFENEKRCGDVLAQKTYTQDCIEHIVRKNENNVAMYYAVDQHTPIISREEYYLARKIKEASKGGWNGYLPLIKTYTMGPLKGFVRVIPTWNGYGYTDYTRASLKAYGVDVAEESIYPYYVQFKDESDESESKLKTKTKFMGTEYEHAYFLTDEELEADVSLTEDEMSLFVEKEDQLATELAHLRESIVGRMISDKHATDSRFFSYNEKPVLKFDENGFTFSKECRNKLHTDVVEIYYNPILCKLLVTKTVSDDAPESSIWWYKDKMIRYSAKALCNTIYTGNGWDKSYHYRIIGSRIKIKGQYYLEFDLRDPIIHARLNHDQDNRKTKTEKADIVEKILKEVVSSKEIYSEIDDFVEVGLVNKVENKSRAVYFNDDVVAKNLEISLEEHKEEKYNPEFVCALKSCKKEPMEGWGYLDGMARFSATSFDIFSPEWADKLARNYRIILDYNSPECERFQYFGWPSEYNFPDKKTVQEEINMMKIELENDKNGRGK